MHMLQNFLSGIFLGFRHFISKKLEIDFNQKWSSIPVLEVVEFLLTFSSSNVYTELAFSKFISGSFCVDALAAVSFNFITSPPIIITLIRVISYFSGGMLD